MTKIYLLILSSLFNFYSFGQTKQTGFPKHLVSTKTTNHKFIPGTNIFIIPPSGFILGDKESTLRFQDSIFINATTMIGISYSQNSKTFTKEKFAKKGKTLIEFSEIRINNLPAKIALYKIENDNVYQIITGSSNFTTIILASYPSTNESLGKSIKKSLETIYCDKALKTDPFYSSNFRFDDTKSIFKLTRSNGSDYFYTKGGVLKSNYDNNPFVIVTQVAIYLGIDFKKIADEELEGREIKVDTTINEAVNYVNSNRTYERTILGKQDGKKIIVLQKVIELDRSILLFQGFTVNDFDKNLEEFKKLSLTIKQQ